MWQRAPSFDHRRPARLSTPGSGPAAGGALRRPSLLRASFLGIAFSLLPPYAPSFSRPFGFCTEALEDLGLVVGEGVDELHRGLGGRRLVLRLWQGMAVTGGTIGLYQVSMIMTDRPSQACRLT